MREYQRRWRAAHPGYQQARDKKQREEGLNATARAYRVIFRAGLMAQARALYAAKKHVS
jgi:mannosyltransferase OCH1-like enzyme